MGEERTMSSEVAKVLRERAEDYDLLDDPKDVRALADYIEALESCLAETSAADDWFQCGRAENAALKALGAHDEEPGEVAPEDAPTRGGGESRVASREGQAGDGAGDSLPPVHCAAAEHSGPTPGLPSGPIPAGGPEQPQFEPGETVDFIPPVGIRVWGVSFVTIFTDVREDGRVCQRAVVRSSTGDYHCVWPGDLRSRAVAEGAEDR